jgi:hemolysin activation/secretion protein
MHSRRIAYASLVIIALCSGGGVARAAQLELTTAAAPRLAAVVIDGSSAFDAARLFAAYREQVGRPISRESARAIVDSIAALYEAEGLVRPEITLDDSLTGRGVLRVQLFEPRVSRVVFEGDAGRYRERLRDIGDRLEQARPLRKDDVGEALRAMRQMTGLAVTANTRRDPQSRYAFELVVRSHFSSVDGQVRMNNRGTDQVGPNFLLGQLFVNNLLGHQDKLGLVFASATDPDEYLGAGLYADTGVGSGDTRASALWFRSRSRPNERPVNYDDEYSRQRAALRVTQPLYQDVTSSVSISAAFEAEDLSIARSAFVFREDRLRIFEGALHGSWRGAGMQFATHLQLRKGVDAFGAGLQALDLRDDARRADFLLAQLSGTVYRRFATQWSMRFDGFAQYTGYVLPDSERFKIGGDRLGRGFEVAEIAGDRGIGGKLELRRDLLSTEGLLGRLSAYGFYDVGTAWKQDLPGRQSATTAGTGLAIQGATFNGYLEVAAPLTGIDVEGRHHASVFAELSYRF